VSWFGNRKKKQEAKESMKMYAKIMDLTLMWIEQNGHLKNYQDWLEKEHGLKMGLTRQDKDGQI
jgi:hypothetical protein|tara:strand:- start:273 stop:464 length:192 start_codon:yes stop_codon:yes gene_type:complete